MIYTISILIKAFRDRHALWMWARSYWNRALRIEMFYHMVKVMNFVLISSECFPYVDKLTMLAKYTLHYNHHRKNIRIQPSSTAQIEYVTRKLLVAQNLKTLFCCFFNMLI